MSQVQQLTSPIEGISCHAWNADRSMVAFSPNNNEIHIYNAHNWTLLWKLTEHDLLVSSIDWSSVTNKIVSCSHDRNAFVWTFEPEKNNWMPSLVILRIDRAALDVKWSTDGKRFAVASGDKCVPVCTYEQSNDWWVCKMVKKKFKSTVLCVDFHPHNGQLLATGCADFKCRVYSIFSSDVDSAVDAGPFTNFGGPVEFGEAYLELSAAGWVNSVAWSPSGNILAYASHDSTVHFAKLGVSAEPVVQNVRLKDLPFMNIMFLNENLLVGVGYDFNPTLIAFTNGEWAFHSVLDTAADKSDNAETEASSSVSRARELFKNKTIRGQDIKADTDTLKTNHERLITNVRNASGGKISTTGLDGRLVLWNLDTIESRFGKLSL